MNGLIFPCLAVVGTALVLLAAYRIVADWRAPATTPTIRISLALASSSAAGARAGRPIPAADKGNPMFAGFKTLAAGLALAVVPQVTNYVFSIDWTHVAGISPNAASIIGLVMVGLRAVTTTAIGQAKSKA